MSFTVGKKHNFLGMQLTFHENSQLEIDMKSYTCRAIMESSMEKMLKPSSMPARSNLFNVNDKSPKLSPAKQKIFHSTVHRPLHVSLRGIRDIYLTTMLPSSIPKGITNEDRMKIRILLCYLKSAINGTAFIGAHNLCTMVIPA